MFIAKPPDEKSILKDLEEEIKKKSEQEHRKRTEEKKRREAGRAQDGESKEKNVRTTASHEAEELRQEFEKELVDLIDRTPKNEENLDVDKDRWKLLRLGIEREFEPLYKKNKDMERTRDEENERALEQEFNRRLECSKPGQVHGMQAIHYGQYRQEPKSNEEKEHGSAENEKSHEITEKAVPLSARAYAKKDRTMDEMLDGLLGDTSGGSIGLTYSPQHTLHSPTSASPENPERIQQIINFIRSREDVLGGTCKTYINFPNASDNDILEVHCKPYLEFVRKYCASGGGFLGDSTYMTSSSYEIASLAAGGAIRAAEMVLDGKHDYGYALVRPPGHHASSNSYGGFCILNNGAILARKLQKQGKKKVMFVDWDAHAGNGTMNIFYEDPSVLKVSIHRSPRGFYPNDGFYNQIGRKEGLGSVVNIELPEGAGDNEYMLAFDEVIMPIFDQFKPDFIICACGFDAHHSEKYTRLNMTSRGLFGIVKMVSRVGKGKMIVLMEGGYNRNNAQLAHTVINALSGKPLPFIDDINSLSTTFTRREKVRKITKENIESLKGMLKDYWKF